MSEETGYMVIQEKERRGFLSRITGGRLGRGARTEVQTVMQKTIIELHKKNSEMDRQLFTVFGKGKNEALIFPTPVEIQEDGKPISTEFLLVTNDGFLAIHFDGEDTDMNVKFVSDEVEENLGRKYSVWNGMAGYSDRTLMIGGHHFINYERAWGDHVPFIPGDNDKTKADVYNNCRLVVISEPRVKEILQLNINRVNALHATSLAVSASINKANKVA